LEYGLRQTVDAECQTDHKGVRAAIERLCPDGKDGKNQKNAQQAQRKHRTERHGGGAFLSCEAQWSSWRAGQG